MRHSALPIFIGLVCASLFSQSQETNETLLARTRSLYDAPFTRNLAAFDCAVQFDWKKHFEELVGKVPATALSTIDKLQAVSHRVSTSKAGVTVSTIPNEPDFSGAPQAATLDKVLSAMIYGGLTTWIPVSSDQLLPAKDASSSFEHLDSGYKVIMDGPNAKGTLLLDSALRVTSGVLQKPEALRITSNFANGANGYVLASITTEPAGGSPAAFDYTYQPVDGFELPSEVTVSPSASKPFRFSLTDCKVVKFVKVNVAPPPAR